MKGRGQPLQAGPPNHGAAAEVAVHRASRLPAQHSAPAVRAPEAPRRVRNKMEKKTPRKLPKVTVTKNDMAEIWDRFFPWRGRSSVGL